VTLFSALLLGIRSIPVEKALLFFTMTICSFNCGAPTNLIIFLGSSFYWCELDFLSMIADVKIVKVCSGVSSMYMYDVRRRISKSPKHF
jgi:hypothetical protein